MKKSIKWMIPILILGVTTFISVNMIAQPQTVSTRVLKDNKEYLPNKEALATAEHLSSVFEYVADTISPSVVTISSRREIEYSRGNQFFPRNFFFDSPFEDFFGDNFRRHFETPPQNGRKQIQMGQGSGVVVNEDGFILTNNHVIKDATEVEVIFSDDRRYPAEIIGSDPKTDLAVIKIDSRDLIAAKLGDSDDLRVGQWVVAAGNPFGLTSSITTGIVSATGRTRVGITDYENFVQTDAAINSGNSGGPLVNLRGEVIGINTAIISQSGGSIGIGFAIPINMAKEVMQELIEEGRVVRGYLGVMIQDLSEGLAKSFDYDSTDGALIGEVVEEGPADKAGIKQGDIITHFEGEPVENVSDVRLKVASVDPGTDVELTIFRNGRSIIMEITIEELLADTSSKSTLSKVDNDFGFTVETLTQSQADRLGIDENQTGVLVTNVLNFSLAYQAGIRTGDVITHVHNTRIRNASDFHKALQNVNQDEGVRLTVVNEAGKRYVYLQINRN